MKTRCILTCLVIASLALALPATADDDSPLPYRIVQRHAHDSTVFTQGLAFHAERLYESGGLYGQSTLRYTTPGETESTVVDLPKHVFAEGLTVFNNRVYVLTWKEQLVLQFDPDTLTLQKSQRYRAEGWGLTTDGNHLVTSDGTDRIRFLDPDTLAVMASIDVRENGKPLTNLNELEWINGSLWANVWLQDRLVQIDPQTGNVLRSLDLSALAAGEAASEDPQNTLNGIAWQASTQTLWVTGKRWEYLYQLQVNGL